MSLTNLTWKTHLTTKMLMSNLTQIAGLRGKRSIQMGRVKTGKALKAMATMVTRTIPAVMTNLNF